MDEFKALEVMCDEYCRFPRECQDQEELEEKCVGCPLVEALLRKEEAE